MTVQAGDDGVSVAALACGPHLSVASGVQELVAAVTLEAQLVPVFPQ